jgi:hypothetical protein
MLILLTSNVLRINIVREIQQEVAGVLIKNKRRFLYFKVNVIPTIKI